MKARNICTLITITVALIGKGQALEKRITDLEKKVQDQPLEIISTLMGVRQKEMSKSTPPHRWRSENQCDERA